MSFAIRGGASLSAPTSAPTLTLTSKTNAVGLSWTSVAGAATYEYERVNYSPGTFSGTPTNTGLTGTTANHTGLTTNTSHSFKIRAVNSAGVGPWSSAVHMTTAGQFEASGNGATSLNWTVPPGITSICAVCIGRGHENGGGGGLGWKNNISINGNSTINYGNGSDRTFISIGGTVSVAGYNAISSNTTVVGGQTVMLGGTYVGDGGGNGGYGGLIGGISGGLSGGSAGGYSAPGSPGVSAPSLNTDYYSNAGTGGCGSSGGARRNLSGDNYEETWYRGGGTGLKGTGSNGIATIGPGNPGSGGSAQNYGAGSGRFYYDNPEDANGGSNGDFGYWGLRFIWGEGRSYPSAAGDV